MSDTKFSLGQPVIYRGKTYTFPGTVCGITDDGQYIVRAIGGPDGSYTGMKHIYGEGQLEARNQDEPTTSILIDEIVVTAMQDAWNDICDDTGFHPLDITHLGRKKIMFQPRHWAAAVATQIRTMLAGRSNEASFQHRVAAAHHALFHDDPSDVAERRARYQEESNETSQAFGMSREEAHRLVDYTWDRPPGEPHVEIGAAMVTLTSLCVVAGHDLMLCAEADLAKLVRPETIERIRAKRTSRHGRGPLPGYDPAAASVETPNGS